MDINADLDFHTQGNYEFITDDEGVNTGVDSGAGAEMESDDGGIAGVDPSAA